MLYTFLTSIIARTSTGRLDRLLATALAPGASERPDVNDGSDRQAGQMQAWPPPRSLPRDDLATRPFHNLFLGERARGVIGQALRGLRLYEG